MRVVVDTNVFVSGLIKPQGAPGAIVDAVIEGRIPPVFSSETLAELQDVLARPRLQRFLTRAAIRPEALLARDEAHLMAAFRYVALNPVKAKLDATPTDWPWYGTAAAPRRWLGD